MTQSVGAVALDIVMGRNTVASTVRGAMNETQQAVNSGSSGISSALGKIGSAAKTAGKVAAVGMGVASTAIGFIGKQAVSAYADYEQLVGGVETLFKDSSSTVIKYANDAYKTAGLSANEYMETVTSFSASLLQSLDGDTAKAADKSNMAITDMADNANKMGTSIEMIQNAYNGFAKQNYTMLDNLKLGYGGTKQEMQRLLEDAEKISGIKYDLSSFADITDAIHVMQTQMGITGTTAKEASSTIQGSVSAMKSAWQNLLTGLTDNTQDMDQLISNFADSVGKVGENLIPRINSVLDGITKVITKLAPKLVAELPKILDSILPALVSGAVELINALVGIIPQLVKQLLNALPQIIEGLEQVFEGIVNALPDLMQTIMKALPKLIPMLINGIVKMFTTIANNYADIIQPIIDNLPDIVISVVDALLDNLPALIMGCIQLVMALVEAQPQIIAAIIESIPEIIAHIIEALMEWAPGLTEAVADIVGRIAEFLTSTFDDIKKFTTVIWDGIKYGITTSLEVVKDVVINVWDLIKNAITVALNAIWSIVMSIWNAIYNTIAAVLNGIVDVILSVWNAIYNFISSIVEAISSTVTSVFNTVKNTVSNIFNGIKDSITSIWTNIKDGVTGAVDSVKDAIETGLNKAWDFIKAIPKEAVQWGKDIIDGLVEGIKSGIDKVGDAASSVGKKIKSFLHFSVPDEGPLTDYESWMPDFMAGLANGITSNVGLVTSALTGLTNDMTVNPALNLTAPQLKDVGTSGSTDTQSQQDSKLDTLIELLKLILDKDDQKCDGTPIYIGNELVDYYIDNKNSRKTIRSGGYA